MSDAGLKSAVYGQIARVGKALGAPGRLAILDALTGGPRTVNDLAQASLIPLKSASAHLQVLKAAGLVQTARRGTHVEYRLADLEVEELWLSLRDVAAAQLPGFEVARRELMGDSASSDPDRLLQAIRDGEAVLLDVRDADEFAAGHVRRARRVDPDGDVRDLVAQLGGDAAVVVQSRGPLCPVARAFTRRLRDEGLAAFVLDLGPADLRRRGFVLVTSE